ncbi:MAG TPA: ATP-binding protein [Desulfurococcaceae archaeon]|nr:ATP-binding protein [Desulfurococcaceae archaeon]
MEIKQLKPVGIVLSGATTSNARMQLTEYGEEKLVEGMLVLVNVREGRERVLARIEGLQPVNEFFREGDAWSEVRRRGLDLPLVREVAKRYVLADIVLLGRLTSRGLGDVRYPPEPGDKVYLLDVKRYAKEVFGVQLGDSGVVWYGTILGYDDAPIPLDVENITMHLGVFGETGSGKSYGVGYLIELLSRIPVGNGVEAALPVIVVDANGDYLDYHKHFLEYNELGKYYAVWRLVFPNSTRKYQPYTRTITISLDEFTSREIAEFIVTYKTGGYELNELQVSGLERVLRDLIAEEPYGYTELLTSRIDLVYSKLEELSSGKGAPIHHQTAKAIRSALEKFHEDIVGEYKIVSSNPTLRAEFIDEITNKPSLVIVDFSTEGAPGIPLPVKQLIIGYLARILYKKFTEYKTRGDERYLLFIIEEVQNYAPNPRNYPISWSLARDYLALIATQGRKFGISLGLVSQRPAFIDPVVLSMINTWIIHRISPEDVGYVVKASGGLPRGLEKKLTSLPRGVAVLAGQMNILGFPVLVEVGKRTVSHVMGRTRVIEALRKLYS